MSLKELRSPLFICSKHDEQCSYLCSEVIEASGLTIPNWSKCHISKEIMKNPVMDDFGLSYEAKIYASYGGEGGQMKPYSKMSGSFDAYPNINLALAIREFWDKCWIVICNKE